MLQVGIAQPLLFDKLAKDFILIERDDGIASTFKLLISVDGIAGHFGKSPAPDENDLTVARSVWIFAGKIRDVPPNSLRNRQNAVLNHVF